tara:strand:- start:340 stop:684 length:345 start_codon:yes stop_codon:yes gene_type:complete
MNLFQELKRRKVFKAVGVYAAASLIIIQVNLVEKNYSYIDHDENPIYYYTDWPLYQYYDANGNAKKALKYLDYAHDNIPDDEQREYLEDRKRMDHLYKYYYVHEINEAYNRQIR